MRLTVAAWVGLVGAAGVLAAPVPKGAGKLPPPTEEQMTASAKNLKNANPTVGIKLPNPGLYDWLGGNAAEQPSALDERVQSAYSRCLPEVATVDWNFRSAARKA